MGIAIMIIPIASFIYTFSGMREIGGQYGTAINISAYCLTSTFITLAYFYLLGHVIEKLIIKIHLILGLLYPLPLWLGLLYGSEAIAKQILIASYTLFCVLGIMHIASCLYYYNKRLKERSEHLSGVEYIELRLLKKTMYISLGLIVVSICFPSFINYPIWVKGIFIFAIIVGTVNIGIHYHMALSSTNDYSPTTIDQIPLEEDSEATVNVSSTLSKDITQNLEKQVQRWVKKGEFLRSNITINDVAKATCTNRTYLSRYINTEYKCSFKTWITNLRLEEAKALMEGNPELSISDIAKQTGFASVESFSHIFTRSEHLCPSKWRESSRCSEDLVDPISHV